MDSIFAHFGWEKSYLNIMALTAPASLEPPRGIPQVWIHKISSFFLQSFKLTICNADKPQTPKVKNTAKLLFLLDMLTIIGFFNNIRGFFWPKIPTFVVIFFTKKDNLCHDVTPNWLINIKMSYWTINNIKMSYWTITISKWVIEHNLSKNLLNLSKTHLPVHNLKAWAAAL